LALALALALVLGGAPLDGARPECPSGTRPANWKMGANPYAAEGCETLDGVRHGPVLIWDPTRTRVLLEGRYEQGKPAGRWRREALWPTDEVAGDWSDMVGWEEYEEGHVVRSAYSWSNGVRYYEFEAVVVSGKPVPLRNQTWRMNGSPSSEFECLEVDRARARCARLRKVQWHVDGSVEEFVGTWEEDQHRALERRRAAATKQVR
jgi:hypothetical protein